MNVLGFMNKLISNLYNFFCITCSSS